MSLIRSEDLDARVQALLEEAAKLGREAERAARETDHRVVSRQIPSKPDLSKELAEQLREALEDEVLVARPVAGEAVIEEEEREREIGKRALAHLRLSRLRQAAEDLGLSPQGKLDEVADRIVRSYNADEEEIARLVIAYETEPPPERKLTTRVYTVFTPVDDVSRTAGRIEHFTGRYIRVGIAKWFVIDDVRRVDGVLRLDGSYRAYQADADRSDEEEYRLISHSRGADASLRLTGGSRFVEIEAKGENESRCALTAFLQASGLRKFDALPIEHKVPEGELFRWDPRSVFLLDLLQTQFRSTSVQIINLTVAGFETGEAEDAGEDARPRVRSVRFHGQHLLDSRPACELLVAGQGLVDLDFIARFSPTRDESVLLPVGIRLHRDHVAVSVGFGTHPPAVANSLRREILRGLQTAFDRGLANAESLNRLANQVRDRALQEKPVVRADLFTLSDPDEAASVRD